MKLMLTDHAILLKRANFDQILGATHMDAELLEELLQDMIRDGEGPMYVVFYRRQDGTATHIVLTEQELQEKYNLERLEGRFVHRFEKILA